MEAPHADLERRPGRLLSYEEIVAEHAFAPRSRGRGARYQGSLG